MCASFVYFHFPSDDYYTYAEDKQPRLCESIAELEDKHGFLIAPFISNSRSPYLLISLENARKMEIQNLREQFESTKSKSLESVSGMERTDDPSGSRASYHTAFSKAMQTIECGICQKIVLSHTIPLDFSPKDRDQTASLFLSTARLFPDRYVALWHTPHTGTWLTATPELLLSGDASSWQTMALAATKKASETSEWNRKEFLEHQIVVQHIEDCLSPYTDSMEIAPMCELGAGNVKHLLTNFSFSTLAGIKPTALLASLHPTPATCGTPKAAALRLIPSIESHRREYYAGYSGIFGNDACRLYVTLRCAKIQDGQATLYAGGGLLAGSEENSEWEEIRQKFQSIKHCLQLF